MRRAICRNDRCKSQELTADEAKYSFGFPPLFYCIANWGARNPFGWQVNFLNDIWPSAITVPYDWLWGDNILEHKKKKKNRPRARPRVWFRWRSLDMNTNIYLLTKCPFATFTEEWFKIATAQFPSSDRKEGNVFGFISSERISTFPFVDIKLSPFCHFWIIYPWLWIHIMNFL